ncbi:GDSL-like Lipase/Acylhydrolase [Diaporthe sp. PMI_573]|nr:GDSL-like Lipase/Acylhydrolase [Diaporthaceae sp. PMI_573]
MVCTNLCVTLFALFGAARGAILTPQPRGGTPSFTSMVIFGDSLSDDGNGSARISNNTWPSDKYYNGRFSNGLVWAEYVAGNLSVPLYDYAVGGATTSNSLVQGYTGAQSTIAVPSVIDQVASFLGNTTPQGSTFSASDKMAVTTPLFVLFAGANDILFNANICASQSYQYLVQAQNLLRGARPEAKVLTLSPPDLSRLPYGFYLDKLAKQRLRTYTHLLGDLLDTSKTSAVNIDLRSLFDDLDYYAAPQAYGFKPLGLYGSCLTGVYGEVPNITSCEDADKHVYWDEYHPTTHAHSWIARRVLDVLSGPF